MTYMPTRTARWPKEVVFCPHVPPEVRDEVQPKVKQWLANFARDHAFTRNILLQARRDETPVSVDIPLWLAGGSFASASTWHSFGPPTPDGEDKNVVLSVHAHVDKALGRIECCECYRQRKDDEEIRHHGTLRTGGAAPAGDEEEVA